MSRVVWLRCEGERDEAANDGTLGMWPQRSRAPSEAHRAGDPPATFEEAFRRHYPRVRDVLNAQSQAGLGLVAVGPEGLEGLGWVEAMAGEANPLILGRHSSAEVFFPGDAALSLRHLALVVQARREGRASVRVRLLDLRTASGFQDEQGRRLEALESEGPLMIRCASLGVMLFPTAEGQPEWPEDPSEAWARIPERVYVDARSAGGGYEKRSFDWKPAYEPDLVDPGQVTLVPSFPGPIFASRDMAGPEPARGELVITSAGGRASLRLGARAAEQGVLLGRYERCETAGLQVFQDAALSRVHLLVIELEGALYAIDTASKNGTWLGDRSLASTKLQPGLALSLAHRVDVEWRPLH